MAPGTRATDNNAHATAQAHPPLAIRLTCDRAINYAFQQNAIPVVRELRVTNRSGAEQRDLTVRLSTEPAFALGEEFHVQALPAGGEFRLAPVEFRLSPAFLAALTERVEGVLHVDVIAADTLLARHSELIALLAPNEWCGLASLPEILAAFVLPNDPAVMRVLDRAAEILRARGDGTTLNGYQDRSRERAWAQLDAIWRALAGEQLRYISPLASFEATGQKIRFPSEALAQRFATCLDLALLFAAACEQAGLHPLLLLHEGHAHAGCWLVDRTLPDPVIDDLQAVRKLVELEELAVLETTALAQDAAGGIEAAEKLAAPHLQEAQKFRLALDVKRARSSRIHPLPLPGGRADDAAAESRAPARSPDSASARAFPESLPPFPEMPRNATRIDLWKSRLLDLSLRNRLLNFRETKGTVQLLSAAPEQVEDQLAAGAELKLAARPALLSRRDPRDVATHTRQHGADPLAEHLREELKLGRLHTALESAEHARRLTELYRGARLANEENGTNTLFLAVGILEWREAEQADRVLRAPLLLLPVELRRKSVIEGFQLRRLDEDARINVTLLEMLRQQFEKNVGGLDPLPGDENGVDVGAVFRIFRAAVRDLAGWEVKAELWLGQFAFTKFLLWKDLADRLDALTRNRVVKHLVESGGATFPNPAEDIQPHGLDERFQPTEIFCPRSADSSQLAAVMAAAAGHDFVLEGPPGTGKSQTITNIIAHCLAHGERVLFVAEKRAALDVVHRRLKEEGLAPFCLELHSNKSGKADVLAQFGEALKLGAEKTPTEWTARAVELQHLRDQLNGYVRALHRAYPCGLSAHACLDFLLPRQNELTVKLGWPDVLFAEVARVDAARQAAGQLAQRAELLGDVSTHPLAPLRCTDWTPAWSESTRTLLKDIAPKATAAQRTAQEFRAWLGGAASSAGVPPASGAGAGGDACATHENLLALRDLAGALLAPRPVGAAFFSPPWEQLARDLEAWGKLTEERAAVRARLAGYDERRLLALNPEALSARWSEANAAWVVSKLFATGAVRKELGSARNDGAKPEAEAVDAILKDASRLHALNATLAAAAPNASAALGVLWNNGEPEPRALREAQVWGESLQAVLVRLAGEDFEALQAWRQRLGAMFAQGTAAFAPTTATGARFAAFARDWDAFAAALDDFAHAAALQRAELDAAPDFLAATLALVARLDDGWRHIRVWCSWQKACAEAHALGLEPLCVALETGRAPTREAVALFDRSLRRELLDAILTQDETLRTFFGHEQQGRIARFRELDETVAKLTRQLIRAKLAAGIPRDNTDDPNLQAELGVLRKELGKKARHMPVRQLLSRITTLMPRVKPCVLMSPLSVAQYLDAQQALFDVVIFDEASQIPVWDAVGAIARGEQLIVVGDPKQLPPTNFFAHTDDGAEAELTEEMEDLESILDELLSSGLRHKRLQWHYRSRHEGLIAFSNRQYYENDLFTFPSPDVGYSGVRFQLVNARYDKGNTRTNRGEAEALVAELVRRLRDPQLGKRSYGVVTFSQAQQLLVENLLDEQRRQHPELEAHFGEEPPVEGEPVFVKNLENVQGDERDVILFSICYGPDERGQVSMNFGPLNRGGGERRLNVAITRAKHEIVVFTTLKGEQIDLTRSRARGVQDLKFFLEYAERGPGALAAGSAMTDAEKPTASEFAEFIAAKLRALGHTVHANVGCSGYRIDLAIVDPAQPTRYLLGIECDGANYERAATARDRDKLRQLVLEGLGWKLHRLWITDWWHDPEGEMEKLTKAIGPVRGGAA